MKHCRFAAAIAALGLLACSGTTDPAFDADLLAGGHFTTDATEYTAHRFEGTGQLSRYRFTVISRFRNPTSATLYLARCFPNTPRPLFSVLAADRSFESAYAQPSGCVGHDQQFEIPPGAVRIDTLQVDGPNSFDGHTQEPYGVKEGTFRLFFDVRIARGDGAEPAPDALRMSNAFVVRALE